MDAKIPKNHWAAMILSALMGDTAGFLDMRDRGGLETAANVPRWSNRSSTNDCIERRRVFDDAREAS